MSTAAERRVPRRVTEQEAKLWRLFMRDAVPLRAEPAPPPVAPAPQPPAVRP
ncbi:MAG: DNA mismatch repair protein MutS, partial [Alphaproteobacteria bacterium]|nr:DNA mismatch repair protein MutS [Alphaproteobacteria bacterium]